MTRHTCLYMSALDKLLQRKKEMETESYEQAAVSQAGESGEGRDPRWSGRSSHDCTAEICEMLNGFVTFTQYFVTKLNLRNFSTLDSAVKNL